MKSFVITIEDDDTSQQAANTCIKSSKSVNNPFTIEKFTAITPKQVDGLMSKHNLQWNYPWIGEEFDLTRERIRQLEKLALCRLRHPSFGIREQDLV